MPVLDPFGRREICPTNTHPNRAKPWFLGLGDWKARRYEEGTGDWDHYSISTENNIVTLKFVFDPLPVDPRGIKGRFPVLALRGDQYPRDSDGNEIIGSEKDQSKLRKRGYMGTQNDWKNAEITMYFKINSVANSGTRAIAFSVRGGPHHSEGGFFGIDPCWGTALYVSVFLNWNWTGNAFEGSGSLQKELRHGDYTYGLYTETPVITGDILNKWVGMKGVFYTKANGNPYIELWLDKNVNNEWELIRFKDDGKDVDGKEDKGGWLIGKEDQNGNFVIKENKCGGASDEKITWGGPGVIFKLDGLTRIDMKWASIREILPPEGWPLRYLLNARGVSPPYSMRGLAAEYGLTPTISLRELSQLL